MTALPKRRKSVRRAEILAAARDIFREKAFDDASMAEIAQRADCVEGTIYSYFRNKRDLLDAILSDFYDRLISDIEPRFASIDGTADRLRFLVARHLQIALDDESVVRIITREVRGHQPYVGSQLHQLNRRYTRFLQRTIADGIARGDLRADLDPDLARDFVFGGLEHTIGNLLGRGRRIEPLRLAREITAMLMAGWQVPAAMPPASPPIARIEERLARLEGRLRRRGAD